ncbi:MULTISPECIES: neocarzinostatin apoprotein domain-containing protein [Mumia]|nr:MULTISPECIES: neocarzinostatin apoprotein domain-containing protein [Mumia]
MTPTLPTAVRGLAVALALGLVMLIGAPGASAAPKTVVSETTGLKDGQTITVSGSGFAPNLKALAVGQCKTGYKGPVDCNLPAGATFVPTDANGKFKAVKLVLKEKFGSVDCTKDQCVIGSGPLPTDNSPEVVAANTVDVKLTFGAVAAAPAPTTAAPAPTTAAPTVAPATTTADDLPKTGGMDSLPVLLLAGSALVLPGLALLVGTPSRRRRGAQA